MAANQLRELKALEGHRVSLALRGGGRLDDCHLVSVGGRRSGTVWVYSGGEDAFVPVDDVVDVWEAA